MRDLLVITGAAVVVMTTIGCAPVRRAQGPAPTPAVHRLPTVRSDAPALSSDYAFGDLAFVLGLVVRPDGSVDPTALAVHRPRLRRSLETLARPWPELAGDERIAWLYNARMAWCLELASRELTPWMGRADAFTLPASMPRAKLLDSPIVIDADRATLSEIDEELQRGQDFRIAVVAPCVTDLGGRLRRAPFDADDVQSTLGGRFNEYLAAGNRLVVDHDARALRGPPLLFARAEELQRAHNERYHTRGASLATALRPFADTRGRDILADATGYRLVERRGPAGLIVHRPSQAEAWVRFGPPQEVVARPH